MAVKRLGKIAIGCGVILILLVILGAVFGGIIIKKVITGAIQQKTGVQVNMDDVNKGNLTYTDPKTGAQLNIGSNKIPDDFPKDFPIYPGATVTSSLSGNQSGQGNGFWLTLTTSDTIDKVTTYYQENLQTNGWTAKATTGEGTGTNWAISKDKLSGYVTINSSTGSGQAESLTSILIVLGEATAPSPTTSQ